MSDVWFDAWHQFALFIDNVTLYNIVSGWVVLLAAISAFRHWNCNERFCLRHGYPHPDHGRPVCGSHYHSHDPQLGAPE